MLSSSHLIRGAINCSIARGPAVGKEYTSKENLSAPL
jgi:hypothetical protein